MTHVMLVRSVALAVAVSACSSTKEEGAPTATAAKATKAAAREADLYVRQGKRDVEELTKGIADGTADRFACAAAMANVDLVELHDKDTATKIRALCRRDVPFAILARLVPLAEKAREGAPDTLSLAECTVSLDMAIEELDRAGTHDDASRALVARADAACLVDARARAGRAARKAK